MPIEFRSDWPLLTLSNRCLNLFGQWRPCFLRYANVLIVFCSPLDRDTVYQISSRSDQQLPRNSFFVFFAPPSGKSANFIFFLTKDLYHSHVYQVWWRYLILFTSYNFFHKHGPRLSNVLGPHCKIESKFKLFFDNNWYSLSREHFCSGLDPIGQKT